jgi:hypothetical protein
VFGYDPSTDIVMLKEPGTHGGVVNLRLYKAAQLQVGWLILSYMFTLSAATLNGHVCVCTCPSCVFAKAGKQHVRQVWLGQAVHKK